MAWLEAARQENFSPETLEVWYREFVRLGWTTERFRDAVLSVMKSKVFGKVTMSCFFENEQLYTSEEINRLVEQRIQNRRLEYLAWHPKTAEEELCRLGLEEVQTWWRNELYTRLQIHADRIHVKCKQLRAQFYQLSDLAKIDLWQKAVAKGIVQDGDPNAMLILPMLVPQMMEDFQLAMKNIQ